MQRRTEYARAIDAAHAEMATLLKKRAPINSRLTELRKSIRALSRLMEKTPGHNDTKKPARIQRDLGLTDAIRKLLSARGALSAVELRARLNEQGLNINSYASGLIVIHNTLRRLQHQKEIDIVKGPNGTMAYPLHHGK